MATSQKPVWLFREGNSSALLAQELEQDEAEVILSNGDYPIWSPESAFSAGAAMLEVLAAKSPSLIA